MGTWGAGGFENDEAADFVADITSVDDIAAVFESLPEDSGADVDADEAARVIAAAECVAAMLGRPAGDMPNDLAPKLAGFGEPDPSLVESARDSLSRILSRSELADLWAEDDPAPFNLAVTSLIDRLNPASPADSPTPTAPAEGGAICSFCNKEIAPEETVSVNIRQTIDSINDIDRGFWCHLDCLNARLHPRHIVQTWKFDPEEIEREAERLLKC